ncbi:TonB-dependent receptor [Sphingomonas nostoxanthinifaciens]|uniref:TonB-dependent receptor n=1 Tax=Sphingomonas nostoxanthinifaciens TaxID=2872652 RepID=UPI001CC1EF63|nr:TonB-dependent receptor [Sphingomonas nostoxanthinifaciens]UAK23077.1 TonB-dependent receptor [Sphingomonas nostoxanthinifaciens]
MGAILLSAALAAAAADSSAPDIVVTGLGLPRQPGDAAYDSVEIDRQRLTDEASGRLENVLRDAAGFAQFRRSDSRSAQPTSQGATLRGLGGNAASRALILLDGVPLADPFGGWVSFSAIDPERLQGARVTRGGGSGIYGPGALAGTIELSSAAAGQIAPLWAEVDYGSRNSVDTTAGVAQGLGGGSAVLSGHYARGDGFVPIIAADRGPVDVAAPYREASVSGRLVFPVGDNSELQTSMLAFSDKRTRGTAFTPNDTRGADASVRLVGRGAWGYEALGYVQVRSFTAGFASINDARTTVTQTLDQYSVPSTGLGGRFELRPPVGTHVQLRIGTDTRYVTGETDELYSYVTGSPTRTRRAGGDALTIGGFAEAGLEPLRDLTLTAGGRIDRWRIDGGFLDQKLIATGAALTNNRYPNREGWRPTARGGFAWKPGGGPVSIRGAAYLGWRLPTLNELYRLYRVGADAIDANPSLKPERLRGIDGGIDYDPLPNLHLSATAFTNRLSDAIANVTMGIGPGTFPDVGVVASGGRYQVRENLRAITSSGAELEARLKLHQWTLAASYAYTDARVHADGTAVVLNGLRPAQTARHQASGTLGWEGWRRVALSATLRYVGPQYEDDLNQETLKGAVTLDATARVPILSHLSVIARAENLSNVRVEAGISGNDIIERATPRTLWIGLRFE